MAGNPHLARPGRPDGERAPKSNHAARSPGEIAEAESRRLWRLAGMGGTLASEILAGAGIGWLLDRLFGTEPTLLVIGTILGVLIGMTTFIRGALRANREMTTGTSTPQKDDSGKGSKGNEDAAR